MDLTLHRLFLEQVSDIEGSGNGLAAIMASSEVGIGATLARSGMNSMNWIVSMSDTWSQAVADFHGPRSYICRLRRCAVSNLAHATGLGSTEPGVVPG